MLCMVLWWKNLLFWRNLKAMQLNYDDLREKRKGLNRFCEPWGEQREQAKHAWQEKWRSATYPWASLVWVLCGRSSFSFSFSFCFWSSFSAKVAPLLFLLTRPDLSTVIISCHITPTKNKNTDTNLTLPSLPHFCLSYKTHTTTDTWSLIILLSLFFSFIYSRPTNYYYSSPFHY